jgi:hypothetical protein
MNHARITARLVLAAVVASCASCGPNYGGRQEIKGTIKLKGQPLDQGLVDFTPLAADGPTKEGATIVKGSYHIDRAHGLMPGKYRVSITAGDGRTPAGSDQAPGPTGANIVSKDRIPPEYNINSKHDVDVTPQGPNVFDFDIP